MASAPIVVSAEWLKEALSSGQKNLVLLDTTWVPDVKVDGFPESSGLELYQSEHIPGALHFDLDACIQKTKHIPRSFPEPAKFQEYLRGLGIGAGSHVICYDRDDGLLMTSAAGPRTCFTLKLYGLKNVSVLNGGLLNWKKKRCEIEQGTPKARPTPGDIVITLQKEMIVDYDALRKIEEEGSSQIVDTRFPVNFNGKEEEPCLFIQLAMMDAKFQPPSENEFRKGHMKNAVNIPFDTFFKDGISFKTKEELQKLFTDAGLDVAKPTVTTCYIGHTASMCSLLATYCGFTDVKVYYGSWTEYGQRRGTS